MSTTDAEVKSTKPIDAIDEQIPKKDPVTEPTPGEKKEEEQQKKSIPQRIRDIFDPREDEFTKTQFVTAVLAELICTFLFVFYCSMTVIAVDYVSRNQNLIIALGQGFALALAIYVAAPASGGHLNPAVTIGVFLVGRINFLRGLCYIIAQFGGAILAAAIARAIVKKPFEGTLGSTVLNPDITVAGAWFLEAIMTFFLVFVMYSTAIDQRGVGKLAPLAIGVVVLIDELIGVHWTGASMNPARTLGPQLVSGTWDHYWLYFTAPVVGSIAACFTYQLYLNVNPVNSDQKERRAKKEKRIAKAMARHLQKQGLVGQQQTEASHHTWNIRRRHQGAVAPVSQTAPSVHDMC